MRDRQALDLFFVSWLVLFLELACIRWFPSHVMFLTFFTNTVLLACFVGMSIGCLVARAPGRLILRTPFALALAVAAGLIVDLNSDLFAVLFAVGDQKRPDVVYFGTETETLVAPPFTIPIEVVAGLFFVLIARAMAGPGQEMGRAFNRVRNRTTAYSANLLGSLAGIGMFAGCSYLQLPPAVWFAAVAVAIGYLVLRPDPDAATATTPAGPSPAGPKLSVSLACLVLTVVLTLFTSGFFRSFGDRDITWSPYYRIDYLASSQFIFTNKISQQVMESLESSTVAPYGLPFLFERDLKAGGGPVWPPFKRILIIGAGSGNDVARALAWLPADARIDAVEIDPVIQDLGAKYHPDHPFQDPRVSVYLNDGRNFLRQANPESYDLVLFALIDSLVLQSGYSNIRLESQLFTLESFQDVRRVLKPTGLFAVYNFFRQGWIAARIRDQLRVAFDGTDPVAMTVPPHDFVPLDLYERIGFTIFFAGAPDVLAPIRTAFRDPAVRYWYPWHTGLSTKTAARFSIDPPTAPPPPTNYPKLRYEIDPKTQDVVRDPQTGKPVLHEIPPEWLGLRPTTIEESKGGKMATDDWPFVYVRNPMIPALTWRGIALTLVLSVGLWWAFGGPRALAPAATTGSPPPEWGLMLRSFFLGAGFMLVETKAVVQMALLFGGTWMVNSVVFAAILVMSLAGNLFAGAINPRRLAPYYLGLFAALGVGLAVAPNSFLGMSPTVQTLGACLVVFAPIAFAGVIFATSFKRTTQPDRVFGANVAGALVGGLAENSSVVLGFRLLLCVAIGFYGLSAAFGNRHVPTRAAEDGV